MDSDEDVPVLLEQGEASRVPLTIICGFLGAGKSTLLKRILTERHGYRIAVIMNEFGDTADIEAKAINVSSPEDPSAENSEEFLELANGCLCCSIKDSGVAAIEKLMQRKGAFDHILLETTGLADPGPIASMFWHNEEFATDLGRDICLDGVVCVVDAVFGQKQMEEDSAVDGTGESLRQVACADVILLNKVDLVLEPQILSTEELLHRVNPAVPVHRTVRGQIDLAVVVGIMAYASPPSFQKAIPAPLDNSHQHDHEMAQDLCHHHPMHYETRGISSLLVACPVLSSSHLDKLDEWIRTVLWENHLPHGQVINHDLRVLRCKGLFTMQSGEQYVLQGVQNLYEISQVDGGDVAGVPQPGKLVLIGKGLDDAVRRSLEDVFK
jgi:G3E family GTPase